MGQSLAPGGSQHPHFGDPDLPPGWRRRLCSGHPGRGQGWHPAARRGARPQQPSQPPRCTQHPAAMVRSSPCSPGTWPYPAPTEQHHPSPRQDRAGSSPAAAFKCSEPSAAGDDADAHPHPHPFPSPPAPAQHPAAPGAAPAVPLFSQESAKATSPRRARDRDRRPAEASFEELY